MSDPIIPLCPLCAHRHGNGTRHVWDTETVKAVIDNSDALNDSVFKSVRGRIASKKEKP